MAFCVCTTKVTSLDDYKEVEIKIGQKVHNVKILEGGRIIFSISPDGEYNYISKFPQMFGLPSDEQLKEVKRLEDILDKSQERINEIYCDIERIKLEIKIT